MNLTLALMGFFNAMGQNDYIIMTFARHLFDYNSNDVSNYCELCVVCIFRDLE